MTLSGGKLKNYYKQTNSNFLAKDILYPEIKTKSITSKKTK